MAGLDSGGDVDAFAHGQNAREMELMVAAVRRVALEMKGGGVVTPAV